MFTVLFLSVIIISMLSIFLDSLCISKNKEYFICLIKGDDKKETDKKYRLFLFLYHFKFLLLSITGIMSCFTTFYIHSIILFILLLFEMIIRNKIYKDKQIHMFGVLSVTSYSIFLILGSILLHQII
jgi:isoprenylcysteine carboxyl methyltransferase (ICMT) family protein YpbQ